jgi:hypothetical protein
LKVSGRTMCRTKKGTIGILTSLENKSYLIEIGKGKSQFHQTLLLSLTLSDQQQHSFPNSSLSLACKFSLSFSSHMNKMKTTTWLNSLPLSHARISPFFWCYSCFHSIPRDSHSAHNWFSSCMCLKFSSCDTIDLSYD